MQTRAASRHGFLFSVPAVLSRMPCTGANARSGRATLSRVDRHASRSYRNREEEPVLFSAPSRDQLLHSLSPRWRWKSAQTVGERAGMRVAGQLVALSCQRRFFKSLGTKASIA
jgi:hypothetical protein